MTESKFNYDSFPEGYYQSVIEQGNPVRRMWHMLKFERALDCLPPGPGLSILDIGCFAGTFLAHCPRERFSRQVGVDILEKQVEYANRRFGTSYRHFQYIPSINDLDRVEGTFDVVTLIEVIEHLRPDEIAVLFDRVTQKLKVGGKLLVSTPNYLSAWPALEVLVNKLSDVSYEEQHLTKFMYVGAEKKMQRIAPALAEHYALETKTTTHFVTPFLAGLSLNGAMRMARRVPHHKWHFPFGNIVLLVFRRVK